MNGYFTGGAQIEAIIGCHHKVLYERLRESNQPELLWSQHPYQIGQRDER